MRPTRICSSSLVFAIGLVASVPTAAQQPSAGAAQARSRVIAASFNKSKNVSKEKHGVKKEKYLRVESEPAVRANPEGYSGRYEVSGMGFGLELRVNRDGSFEGTGYEPLSESVHRSFVLRSGRIQGALLTATKVYAGGASEPFEGAFMNRSTFESPTDTGFTVFGLGTLGRPVNVAGMTINKFFYERIP